MVGPAMHNRRHGRVRARGVASHLREGAHQITGLAVENLSRGGAFVRCAVPMPPGTPVMLDLVKPGLKRAVQLTGRVVSSVSADEASERRTQAGMGIQFDPYPAAVGERLTEILLSLGAGPEVLGADPPPPARPSVTVPQEARLMIQVKGLLMELGDWQQRVSELERENAALKDEVVRLRARLGE